jgi:hypothetical protein
MAAHRLHAWAKVLGINLIIALVGVIALELALGHWFAPYHPPSGSIFRRTFKLEQRYYEPHGVITYVRDEYGLRGPEKDLKKIEVATVGGSTTDQILLSEGQTWQDAIYALTGIGITNAGDEGISSTGHVIALTEWLHRIPNFHPRFYLHYIGLNDAAFAYLWTLPGSKAFAETQIADQENRHALHRFIRGRSALVQGYIALKSWLSGPPEVFSAAPAPRQAGAPEVRAEVNEQSIADYIRQIYEPNLRRLILEHQKRREQAIMVSQTTRPSLFRVEGDTVWVRDPGVAGYVVALRLMNAATRRVCMEYASTCHFIDLASEISFSDDEFYDRVHTTPAGARRIGVYLAEKLLPIVRSANSSATAPRRTGTN